MLGAVAGTQDRKLASTGKQHIMRQRGLRLGREEQKEAFMLEYGTNRTNMVLRPAVPTMQLYVCRTRHSTGR